MKDLLKEITNTENKLNEFSGISDKIYDTKIEMSKVESSIKELKRFTDTLHNEILLLQGKDEDFNQNGIVFKEGGMLDEIVNFLRILDEDDDIQNIYTNAKL